MSTAGVIPYSVAQQKTFISSDLNSTLLLQFLFGIYTGLFPATIYIYVRKENRTRARDRIIIGGTTALYSTTALFLLINWLYTNILFCTKGTTRFDMFVESVTGDAPLGVEIIVQITNFVVYLFADGLLVWRCFHSCGSSFRRTLLPIFLLVVETALALTVPVYNCLLIAKPDFETIQTILIADRLSAVIFVAVAATSIVSTFVICLQIWRRTSLRSRSRKRYQTIIHALIESSALYTFFVLFTAILNFTGTGDAESSFRVLVIGNFVAGVTQLVSGLAPTLMVARLLMSSDEVDVEASSARLPTDLMVCAANATTNMHTDMATHLEMHRSQVIGDGEETSEPSRVVAREVCHTKNDVEDRVTTLV